MEDHERGYARERFKSDVDEGLHCPICQNVLKDPKQCRNNEHHFCLSCIEAYLENFNMCPCCREGLSLETLREPQRYLTNSLNKLEISCNYFRRGCPQFVKVEELQIHVTNCEFAPVNCSNDGCTDVINRRDKTTHETGACKYREWVSCDYCAAMSNEVNKIKQQLSDKEKIIKEFSMKMSLFNFKAPEDIIIAGGAKSLGENTVEEGEEEDDGEHKEWLKSVEKFTWSDRKWQLLQPTKELHDGLSSVVYNGEMIVCGGAETESIEVLNISQEYPQWRNLPAKLPIKVSGHKSVVFQHRLIVIGGKFSDKTTCNAIYEICLFPPYSSKLLTSLPYGMWGHGVELFGDKILIFGRHESSNDPAQSCGVVLYDLTRNELAEMPPLEIPAAGVATVSQGDNIIVIGGYDEDGYVLNSAMMYNVKTGKTTFLPPMKYCRAFCAAVLTGNGIVVMGGCSFYDRPMDSVEHFNFETFSWEELPPMIEPRDDATAVAVR